MKIMCTYIHAPMFMYMEWHCKILNWGSCLIYILSSELFLMVYTPIFVSHSTNVYLQTIWDRINIKIPSCRCSLIFIMQISIHGTAVLWWATLHLYAERLQGYFMVCGTTPNTNTSEIVIPDALTSQWYQCRETILVAIIPVDTKNYLVKPDSNWSSDYSSSIFLRYNSYGLFVLFNTEYICTTMNQSWSPVVCNWGYTRGIMH